MKPATPPPKNNLRPIDLGSALLASSNRLSLDQLVRQGRQTVSLLSKERMGELINRAVRELIEYHRAEAKKRKTAEAPPQKSAYESLQELLQQVSRTNQAKAELESSRKSLLSDLDDLRKDLAREKARAEEDPLEALGRSAYLGVADFDREITGILNRVCENRLPPPGPDRPAALVREWGQVEKLLRQRVFAVVQEERARYRNPARDNKELWRMEKRVEKLYSEIDALENALRLITNSKVNNPLIQKALRELGLLTEDKNSEKKREMLKVVLEGNQQIRKTCRDLESRGISLARPR